MVAEYEDDHHEALTTSNALAIVEGVAVSARAHVRVFLPRHGYGPRADVLPVRDVPELDRSRAKPASERVRGPPSQRPGGVDPGHGLAPTGCSYSVLLGGGGLARRGVEPRSGLTAARRPRQPDGRRWTTQIYGHPPRCAGVTPRLHVMDPVVTGGLIGVGGTLLGVSVQDLLTRMRERGNRRLLARRAVTAITGELIATVSILDKALERQAWWPEGDEPRRDEWNRYRDALAEEVHVETVMRIGIAYDTIRSLAATRSSPLTPASTGRLRKMLRDDPQGRSFFSLIWTNDRWPWAAVETEQTRAAIWEVLTEHLWPLQKRLLKRSEDEPWQLPEGETSGIRPGILLAPNGAEWRRVGRRASAV